MIPTMLIFPEGIEPEGEGEPQEEVDVRDYDRTCVTLAKERDKHLMERLTEWPHLEYTSKLYRMIHLIRYCSL